MVMPVKNKGILIIIFGIYTRCQQMKVGDMCRKIYIIRPKPGPVAKNATPKPSGWESNPPSDVTNVLVTRLLTTLRKQ